MKPKSAFSITLRHVALAAAALIGVFPFYWMIVTSLKPANSVLEFPPRLIPVSFDFSNYLKVFEMAPIMPIAYLNSFKVAILATLGTLFTSALAAYAFSKMRFRGQGILFGVLLGTLMIPSQVTLIPMYIVFAKFGWVDTHLPLIVPQVLTNAYGVFMIRQYMVRIPREYIEAAQIDGCGYFRSFLRIMLPLSKPILITLGLLTFVGSWNNYFTPLIFLNSEQNFTVPLAVASFRSVYTIQWELMMAAAAIAVAPVVVLFLASQKYFVESIALSGIK